MTLTPVGAWCNDESGNVTISATAGNLPGGWAGSELILRWYVIRNGQSSLLETTTYQQDESHLSITVPKSTFQSGDEIYVDFETTYDTSNISSKCEVDSQTGKISLTINEPATLTSDLQEVDPLCAGDGNVTYTVNATGTNLQFSWYKDNGTLLSNTQDKISIQSTATGSALTISNLEESDAGSYYVIVSNGSSSVCTESDESLHAELIILLLW